MDRHSQSKSPLALSKIKQQIKSNAIEGSQNIYFFKWMNELSDKAK